MLYPSEVNQIMAALELTAEGEGKSQLVRLEAVKAILKSFTAVHFSEQKYSLSDLDEIFFSDDEEEDVDEFDLLTMPQRLAEDQLSDDPPKDQKNKG